MNAPVFLGAALAARAIFFGWLLPSAPFFSRFIGKRGKTATMKGGKNHG
jgi:hypothetical protein